MNALLIEDLVGALNNIRASRIVANLALALLITAAGLILSRLIKRWLSLLLDRSRIRDDLLLKGFFLRLTSFIVITLTLLAALANLGLNVTTFITGLGVTGIILGFGLRDTLSNLAAGLLLLIYRPFRAGEMIEVEGSQGMVYELTIVNMQMITNDGVRVIMPNSKVWGAKITNYSMSKSRRLEFNIKVDKAKVNEAINCIKAALDEDERVLKEPAPLAQVTALAETSAALTIWAWTAPENFTAAQSDGYLRLLTALGRAQIQTF
jgi:small conductance mechanosensitive channel